MTSEKSPGSRGFHDAYVVFCDVPKSVLLRPLRRGFRHCFVLLRDHDRWISIDPLFTHLEVMTHDEPGDNALINHFRKSDFCIVLSRINKQTKRVIPFVGGTCVSTVKRVLGVSAPWIVTPYQLFHYLNKRVENVRVQNGVTLTSTAPNPIQTKE